MQQKQRLKHVESYVKHDAGILIATDIASRGLDIPNIHYIIHYDIARTPQVCII